MKEQSHTNWMQGEEEDEEGGPQKLQKPTNNKSKLRGPMMPK